EIIEMADLGGGTPAQVTPVNGVPPGCASIIANDVPAADLRPPSGGLSGTVALVDVPIGTYYASTAIALDGVYNGSVYTPPGSTRPDLSDASAGADGFVTAYVPLHGSYATLNYPPAQAIDAVSAVLAASEIVSEYDISSSEGAQTDWVIT